MTRYEWAVMRSCDNPNVIGPHRGPMTEAEAKKWVDEWEQEVAPQARKGMFVVIRRSVGDWRPA